MATTQDVNSMHNTFAKQKFLLGAVVADASELRLRPHVETTSCGRLAVKENIFMRSEP
jgi:hypothetical protein